MKKKIRIAHNRYIVRPNVKEVKRVFYDERGIVLDYTIDAPTPMHYQSIFELTTGELHTLIGKAIDRNDQASINAVMRCAIASGRKKFCRRYDKYFPRALATIYGSE